MGRSTFSKCIDSGCIHRLSVCPLQEMVRAIKKGVHGPRGSVPLHKPNSELQLESDAASVMSEGVKGGKPWKRHHNQHKKEKTRRTMKLHDFLYQ